MERTHAPISLREKLIDQLAYLADEADALQSVIRHVPQPVLETHPIPGELSVKELYAVLVRTDEAVNRPFVQALVAGTQPRRREPPVEELLRDDAWNDVPIARILTRLARSRRHIVSICESAPEESWTNTGETELGPTDLYSCLYDIVQHDVDVLRQLGERLHDARLSGRLSGQPQ